MIRKAILLLTIIIITGCKEKKELRTYTVVPDIDHWEKDSMGNYIKSSIRFEYYGYKNIIIDSLDNFYYYSYEIPFKGMCVIEDKKEIPAPDFINLKPLDIIDLDENNIEKFASSNLANKNPLKTNIIVFSSQRKEFTSPVLDKILSELNNSENNLYMIRSTTEEERIVLEHYKNGEDYYYFSIDWDTTKVKLNF